MGMQFRETRHRTLELQGGDELTSKIAGAAGIMHSTCSGHDKAVLLLISTSSPHTYPQHLLTLLPLCLSSLACLFWLGVRAHKLARMHAGSLNLQPHALAL